MQSDADIRKLSERKFIKKGFHPGSGDLAADFCIKTKAGTDCKTAAFRSVLYCSYVDVCVTGRR